MASSTKLLNLLPGDDYDVSGFKGVDLAELMRVVSTFPFGLISECLSRVDIPFFAAMNKDPRPSDEHLREHARIVAAWSMISAWAASGDGLSDVERERSTAMCMVWAAGMIDRKEMDEMIEAARTAKWTDIKPLIHAVEMADMTGPLYTAIVMAGTDGEIGEEEKAYLRLCAKEMKVDRIEEMFETAEIEMKMTSRLRSYMIGSLGSDAAKSMAASQRSKL